MNSKFENKKEEKIKQMKRGHIFYNLTHINSVSFFLALGQITAATATTTISAHYPSSDQTMQFTLFASPLPKNMPIVSYSFQPQMILYYGHHDATGSQKDNNVYPQRRGSLFFQNKSFDSLKRL
jgi:hypothetical protein